MTAAAPPRRGVSLTLRLVGAALIWMLVLLSIGGAVLTAAFRESVLQDHDQRLDALLRGMIAVTDIGPDGSVVILRPLGDPRFDQIFSGWYWQVAEPSGRLIRSRSLWDSTLPVHDDGTEIRRHEITGPRGEALLVVERDLRFPGAAGVVHVQVASDRRELDERIRSFDLLLLTALGLFAIGMAVAVILQVRYGLNPLRAMTADLAAIRRGDNQRLGGIYPQEIAPVAEAMNAVLEHDTALIERARTHVGNLAHSLKTPLAVLRTEMQGSPDKAVMNEQLRIMSRLIEHHLARASATAGSGRVLGSEIAVKPVVTEIAAILGRIHADRRITVDIDMAANVQFRGRREDLEEMLGNLLENAWKWARSRVRITGQSADQLVIGIEDDGPGLSPEQAEAVSRRGVRLDEAMPGWGLGLGIVADLVAINGGTLILEQSDLGGVRAVLSLPRDEPASGIM
ncbi:sensor histidine kinase [Ferrovibrio sp.]|uniref:sensor histidine kinase n=1 Tax=Ferrovibrio sp. TaxID=1917215 RepID=UPI002627CCDA|nr:sensor histidine kinase [Ferrovibrio sp.]